MKKSVHARCLMLGITILVLTSGCAQPSITEAVPPAQQAAGNSPQSIAEAENLAGFDVKEPAYLPQGVSFVSATYQTTPNPNVTQQFKIVHDEYGDMGNFFQIMQEIQSEAPPDVLSCGENTEGCEVLQINNVPVVYHQNPSGPEGLDWYADGFVFRLLRTAGEPNKVYKDELIKVVESMI